MTKSISRRALLAALPVSLASQVKSLQKKGKPLPSVGEFVRFADPTTENPVVRLTNPRSASALPTAANHFISVKERFLVFSSDRNGSYAPFAMDLRTGIARQVAETTRLAPRSLNLDAQEHSVYFVDGNQLKVAHLNARKTQTITEGVSGFSLASSRLFVIRDGRLERQDAGGNWILLAEDVTACQARLGGAGCLFVRQRSEGQREFWFAGGRVNNTEQPVLLASGPITDPFWAPDGKSVIFLRDVAGRGGVMLSEIHEVILDSRSENCVSPTSQFASFAPNGDGSVFAGASRSKAQPNVVLMLRTPHRELTLCEHRASRPDAVSPVFSPDSRRVYFESDHQGKAAIYSVNVELLVEPLPVTSAS